MRSPPRSPPSSSHLARLAGREISSPPGVPGIATPAAARLPRAVRTLWLVGLGLGALLIAWASRVYFDADELPPFVIEKIPLPLEGVWLVALDVHVVAAVYALPACLLLSLKVTLRRPRVHRWLGRVTGTVVLLALVPSGLYLALFAKGGLPATVGFALSGVIAAVAMTKAVASARARDTVSHRRFTLHVLGQLSVAVTSRSLLYLLDAAGLDPDGAYLFSLWTPVLLSFAFVESYVPRRNPRRKSHANDEDAHPAPVPERRPGLGHAA